jgi:hypothetical protein
MDLEFDKRWRDLLADLHARFEQPVDLTAVIFLVGVQELGASARIYKKHEKVDLMHVGICALLLPFGYYKALGRDAEGWPHFERVQDLPPLGAKEQERLMKEAVLNYFAQEPVIPR